MTKWQDEIYTSYKVESIISILAAASIGFLWKFLPDLLPFVGTKQISFLYLLKVVSCLSIALIALGSYIFYLLKIPKYNVLTQQEHEDMQRRRLGAFVLEEYDQLKKEKEALIKRPPPSSPSVFAQYKEDGRFLDGQEEALLRFSRWLKPPDS